MGLSLGMKFDEHGRIIFGARSKPGPRHLHRETAASKRAKIPLMRHRTMVRNSGASRRIVAPTLRNLVTTHRARADYHHPHARQAAKPLVEQDDYTSASAIHFIPAARPPPIFMTPGATQKTVCRHRPADFPAAPAATRGSSVAGFRIGDGANLAIPSCWGQNVKKKGKERLNRAAEVADEKRKRREGGRRNQFDSLKVQIKARSVLSERAFCVLWIGFGNLGFSQRTSYRRCQSDPALGCKVWH